MADSNISILQYIRSGKVSIEQEITNIWAGREINIKIKEFIANSPDYHNLQQIICQTRELADMETNLAARDSLRKKYADLIELEKAFKTDVLQLASIFSRLDARTQRLQQSRDLFEQGKFSAANQILKEEDLANDQFNLIVYVDYLELSLNNLS